MYGSQKESNKATGINGLGPKRGMAMTDWDGIAPNRSKILGPNQNNQDPNAQPHPTPTK